MKKSEIILFSLFLSLNIYAQNITNTLGASGVFKIKDGTTDYLSLDQATGNLTLYKNLDLGGGTNINGVITKNGIRFIHTTSGNQNTFIGIEAGNLTMNYSAIGNTGVGDYSLTSLTLGDFNSAFGYCSMQNNTDGTYNSAYGLYALRLNTSGHFNSAFGTGALLFNLTGSYNTAFGTGSLYNNTASNNSAFGSNSLYSNTTGISNSAFGFQSLYTNSTGNNNSAFGFTSLYSNTTGNQNSAFGLSSLRNNSTGSFNSGFGYLSLYNNTTGYENCAFGSNALNSNSTGWHNTAVGYDALVNNTIGWQNTAVGHHSLQNNTGNYNTAIGYNAGSNVTTGENLTLIGTDANPSSPTAIDQITLGNQFVGSLRCNVQTITSLSDIRDKKNIEDLTLGLDFITKLKPRQFNWDRRDWYEGGVSDGSKIQEKPTAGFIAQELDEVQNSEQAEWLNLVLKDNPDKWEATPGNLFPVVVKAIQELKSEKDVEIAKLVEENKHLRSELENLQLIKEQLTEIQGLKEELIEQINLVKSKDEDEKLKFSSAENQREE